MVFLPPDYWNSNNYNLLPIPEKAKALRLVDKQLIGYNFVSLRGAGDQPGQPKPKYWSSWKTLPQGAFIPPIKLSGQPYPGAPVMTIVTNIGLGTGYQIYGFNKTNSIPFPSEQAPGPPYITLPYIAFNFLGQLTSGQNEYIPLAQGNVYFPRDPAAPPTVPQSVEMAPGNTTNSYNIVSIDWLTGRTRVERQEVQ
jgi:hypothetical protein